jgi:signal transduction histidine kinase
MSLISLRDKTIHAKIVYYGAAVSGKTTSLKAVHDAIDPEKRIELVSLNTEGDRTLFFDFLPIPLGTLSGFQVKIQAFTVPGQVKYNLTRRYVLRGADAVIFVADSRPEAFESNVLSFQSLVENLQANGLDASALPLVVQYNKRDVEGATSVADLRAALNKTNAPDFETTAHDGGGTFEAFTELCARMMSRLATEYRIGDPAETRRLLLERLGAVGKAAAARRGAARQGAADAEHALAADEAPVDAVIQVAADGAADDGTPEIETLLERAVETNMASARLVSELNETKHRLADHVRQLAALHDTGVVIASELDGERLVKRVLDGALATVGAQLGSVLLFAPAGDGLVEKMVRGFVKDPLAGAGGDDVFARIVKGAPFVLESGTHEALLAPSCAADPRPAAALVAPLVHQGEALGAIVAYFLDPPLDADATMRLRFLAAVAAQAAAAIENSRLYARVETLNRDLERKVAERTRDLEQAFLELKELDRLKDDFLSSMSHELLTPLTSISSFAEILSGIAADASPSAAGDRAEFAGIVHRESAKLTEMVRQLLDLSGIEAGKVAMTPVPLDLEAGVMASYRRLRRQFKTRRITLKLRAETGLAAALADARWMERVFDALLGNAAKFAPEGSEVVVLAREVGGFAKVEVRDVGAGVPEPLREKVFDRFKQLGDVLTDKPPGLGLGLPTARAVIERLGGHIWYEPVKAGGCAFVFTIPIATSAAHAAKA